MGIRTLTGRGVRPLVVIIGTLAIALVASTFGGSWAAFADEGTGGTAPNTLPGTVPPEPEPEPEPGHEASASPEMAFAIAGDGEAGVVWAAPRTGDPGDVRSYAVTPAPASGEHIVDAPLRHLIVGGLTNGVEYVFTVVAIGPGGVSAPTTTNAVIPGESESVDAGQLEKLERHIQDKLNKAHARFQDARGKAFSNFEKHEGQALAKFEKRLGKTQARFERFEGKAHARIERARGTRRFEKVHVKTTRQLERAAERLETEIARIEERLAGRLGDLSERLHERLGRLHEKLSDRIERLREQILERIEYGDDHADEWEPERLEHDDDSGQDPVLEPVI